MNKKLQDRSLLLILGTIVMLFLIFGGRYVWDSYEFRRWVCGVSDGYICYDIFPVPEHTRKKDRAKWKERYPARD